MECINFDQYFAEFTNDWLEENEDNYPTLEALEDDMPKVYLRFLNTPAP
ncbi:MAG: hypothetical protein GX786_01515, partial [Clostridiales bacterium]|nr:hypothetical protein [Clostridiales bacterium]